MVDLLQQVAAVSAVDFSRSSVMQQALQRLLDGASPPSTKARLIQSICPYFLPGISVSAKLKSASSLCAEVIEFSHIVISSLQVR